MKTANELSPDLISEGERRRFWAKVERVSGDECWRWLGAKSSHGYGSAKALGKNARAHRVAYALANGPIPPGVVVMHSCDNPRCCNPAHLSLGSQSSNILDCVTKGRWHQAGTGGAGRKRHLPKTNCPQGHEFTPENTYTNPRGNRICRECARRMRRAFNARTRPWLTRRK